MFLETLKSYLNLFWLILKTDLVVYRQNLVSIFINTVIWMVTFVAVVTYVFPQMGMADDYGAFICASAVISLAFWDIWTSTTVFIADLEGNKTVTYFFTLPLPTWLFFVKNIVYSAIRSLFVGLMVLPMGKIILLHRLDLSNANWFKFSIMLITADIFLGVFALFFASLVKSTKTIEDVGIRLLFPIWFFGGTQFSWYTLYHLSQPLAYGALTNPLLYATEGIRVTLLGQPGNLPYWICFLALWFFILILGAISIMRLKKRLDFV